MQLNKIHHVAINSSDYNSTIDFYVDKLGFEIIRENKRDRGDIKLDLKLEDAELEVFINPNLPARPNYPEAYGLRHLAFKVNSVLETAEELKKLGIKTEPIRVDDYTNLPMMFFFDPDGLPLEIHE
ncbi:MAG: VOC family protein [Lactobacillaceae bacterium]|jgi:glyoxylase I family protein|nr:VOC family protein [Lactobacillaceae bacterium]